MLDGLRNHGWIDGRNLIIEYRFTHPPDRLPASVADLIALGPDVIAAAGPHASAALKSATATIPIVFVAVADPVGLGLVQSLARPGGSITGLATYAPGNFVAKRIEILKELVPGASKFAVLANPGNPMHRMLMLLNPPKSGARPIAETLFAGLLAVIAIHIGFNEGFHNWQALWTAAAYGLLGTTLWQARVAIAAGPGAAADLSRDDLLGKTTRVVQTDRHRSKAGADVAAG